MKRYVKPHETVIDTEAYNRIAEGAASAGALQKRIAELEGNIKEAEKEREEEIGDDPGA